MYRPTLEVGKYFIAFNKIKLLHIYLCTLTKINGHPTCILSFYLCEVQAKEDFLSVSPVSSSLIQRRGVQEGTLPLGTDTILPNVIYTVKISTKTYIIKDSSTVLLTITHLTSQWPLDPLHFRAFASRFNVLPGLLEITWRCHPLLAEVQNKFVL